MYLDSTINQNFPSENVCVEKWMSICQNYGSWNIIPLGNPPSAYFSSEIKPRAHPLGLTTIRPSSRGPILLLEYTIILGQLISDLFID